MRGLLALRDGLARKVTSEPRLAGGEKRERSGGSGGGQGRVWGGWQAGAKGPGRGGEEQRTGVRGLGADLRAGQATQGLCSPESLAGPASPVPPEGAVCSDVLSTVAAGDGTRAPPGPVTLCWTREERGCPEHPAPASPEGLAPPAVCTPALQRSHSASRCKRDAPPTKGWGPGAVLRRRTLEPLYAVTPGGRLLSPSRSSRRLLEGHALLPCLPERWRASGVTRLLPPGGLHHFASDHQLAGVSHPHPAPAQGPSPGILASLSLSDGDREAPFVPSPEDREQAGFMAAGLVHRAGVGGEVLRGSRGRAPSSPHHSALVSCARTLLGRPEPQFLLLRTGASDGANLTGPGGEPGRLVHGRAQPGLSHRGGSSSASAHADRSWVPTRPRGTNGPPDAPAARRPCCQDCPASLSRNSPLWSNLEPTLSSATSQEPSLNPC
ncbi:unnamed protein product [Rangifer tarandus platyrhynchus]|uniref:Uncharacterized protein n=1 Tax=Rangifer tarandus platyrhynchus TaxID=3082113 RepID=A0AC59ZQ85_RANTA